MCAMLYRKFCTFWYFYTLGVPQMSVLCRLVQSFCLSACPQCPRGSNHGGEGVLGSQWALPMSCHSSIYQPISEVRLSEGMCLSAFPGAGVGWNCSLGLGRWSLYVRAIWKDGVAKMGLLCSSMLQGTGQEEMASSWTFRLDIRKNMFHQRFVQPWNRLPVAVVEPSSLQGFVRCVLALGIAILRGLLDSVLLKVLANLSNLMTLRSFVMRWRCWCYPNHLP